MANIQDFDEYSLTSFASTTSSSLVELSQPQQAQPTADDDDNDDDDAIPKATNAYNNNPNAASNPVPIALVNIRQKLEETEKLVKSKEAEQENLDEQLLNYKNKQDTLQVNEKALKSQLEESTAENKIKKQNISELTTEVVRLKETVNKNECSVQELIKQLADKQEENNLLQKEKVEKISKLKFSTQKFDGFLKPKKMKTKKLLMHI